METVQEKYYKWLNMQRTGQRWIIALVTKLWEVSWFMWVDQNDTLHTAITPRKAIAICEANATMRTLYLEGYPAVLHSNRQLFDAPLNIVLKRTLPEKQLWIDSILLAQQEALTHHREWAPPPRLAHHQARQALRAWLNSTAPTPSLTP
jgi:hypothetical protein